MRIAKMNGTFANTVCGAAAKARYSRASVFPLINQVVVSDDRDSLIRCG